MILSSSWIIKKSIKIQLQVLSYSKAKLFKYLNIQKQRQWKNAFVCSFFETAKVYLSTYLSS